MRAASPDPHCRPSPGPRGCRPAPVASPRRHASPRRGRLGLAQGPSPDLLPQRVVRRSHDVRPRAAGRRARRGRRPRSCRRRHPHHGRRRRRRATRASARPGSRSIPRHRQHPARPRPARDAGPRARASATTLRVPSCPGPLRAPGRLRQGRRSASWDARAPAPPCCRSVVRRRRSTPVGPLDAASEQALRRLVAPQAAPTTRRTRPCIRCSRSLLRTPCGPSGVRPSVSPGQQLKCG